MSQPSLSDLVLPEQPTLNNLLTSLKKQSLSPHNRLRSILRDAEFVSSVSSSLGGRPLVANERCGSWYVQPSQKRGSAYFKSTDGHTGQWGFSCRRLNLHLLDIIEENDGCIIVDSTRRGKRMPDALSKTIPIWCAVINAALFPDQPRSHTPHTPPNVVPSSEHSQIAALLPTFLSSLLALALDLPSLRTKLSKPLRPLWVTPGTQLGPETPGREAIFDEYRPVVCCTASSKSSGELANFEGYVQGAADDTEHWAMGLTAPLFWAHLEQLLSTPEEDLPTVISDLLAEDKRNAQEKAGVAVANSIHVRPLPLPPSTDETECQVVFLDNSITPREEWVKGPRRMEVGLGNPRQASKNLRSALPAISSFAESFLLAGRQAGLKHADIARDDTPNTKNSTGSSDNRMRLIIACPTGKDLSLATALALHCRLFNPDEELLERPVEDASLNKTAIRQRLGHMMIAFPEANPHRATLQSVNSFLMG